jgi:inorganic pyrophosphatase
MLGKTIEVTIDRPLGSVHPNHPNIVYPINYGYVEGIIAPDGEEQDVYIVGVDKPLKKYKGIVIAIIKRNDDIEDKWVATDPNRLFTKEEINNAVAFQEQYFDITIEYYDPMFC